MPIGEVIVTQLNLNQGGFTSVERCFLYIGKAGDDANNKKIIAINSGSKLDDLFGKADSSLKTQVSAAILNAASDAFYAYAIPIDPLKDDYLKVMYAALEKPNDLKIEAVVNCTPITASKDITDAQAGAKTAISTYGKYITIHCCVEGIKTATEKWADYKARIKLINATIAADRVSVTPLLHGNNLGVVTGRLCSPSVTIADTPMRVATGALVGLGADPVDMAGLPLTMADIKEMSDARFSVPQWYLGYQGMYWADHPLLDAEGGDFQVYENLRVLDYLARRVRILAIARIADRYLNGTSKSIAVNKTYFMSPLREAAQPIKIGPMEFPGIIQPPQDTDISIEWKSRTEVVIGIMAAPHNCPKKIWIYLALDLTRYTGDSQSTALPVLEQLES